VSHDRKVRVGWLGGGVRVVAHFICRPMAGGMPEPCPSGPHGSAVVPRRARQFGLCRVWLNRRG
jgi:hypothetical protein